MLQNDGCDPELRLSLGGSCADSRSADTIRLEEWLGSSRNIPQEERQTQKQLTIFYNGQICVYDVAEIQARAIITMARREMDERLMIKKDRNQLFQEILPDQLSPPPAADLQQLLMNESGISMKRSLQRFLQKRKGRLDAASPYNTHKHQLLFPIKS